MIIYLFHHSFSYPYPVSYYSFSYSLFHICLVIPLPTLHLSLIIPLLSTVSIHLCLITPLPSTASIHQCLIIPLPSTLSIYQYLVTHTFLSIHPGLIIHHPSVYRLVSFTFIQSHTLSIHLCYIHSSSYTLSTCLSLSPPQSFRLIGSLEDTVFH